MPHYAENGNAPYCDSGIAADTDECPCIPSADLLSFTLETKSKEAYLRIIGPTPFPDPNLTTFSIFGETRVEFFYLTIPEQPPFLPQALDPSLAYLADIETGTLETNEKSGLSGSQVYSSGSPHGDGAGPFDYFYNSIIGKITFERTPEMPSWIKGVRVEISVFNELLDIPTDTLQPPVYIIDHVIMDIDFGWQQPLPLANVVPWIIIPNPILPDTNTLYPPPGLAEIYERVTFEWEILNFIYF